MEGGEGRVGDPRVGPLLAESLHSSHSALRNSEGTTFYVDFAQGLVNSRCSLKNAVAP